MKKSFSVVSIISENYLLIISVYYKNNSIRGLGKSIEPEALSVLLFIFGSNVSGVAS